MSSILIQHKSEKTLDESKIGIQLQDEVFKCLKETMTVTKESGKELANLLGVDYLPNEVILRLFRPWQRANMLATWCQNIKLPEEKQRIKNLIKTLKKLKIELAKNYDIIAMLMLFETSTELNLEVFLQNIDDAIYFFEKFSQLEFANGKNYSAKYFLRYALNSLFYMGKKMGLSEKGAPTQLNEYIYTVTNKLYQDIDQDHYKFNKINFIEEFEKDKNTSLWFIFNPYCKLTNAMLSDISARFLVS